MKQQIEEDNIDDRFIFAFDISYGMREYDKRTNKLMID
jgi:hypothetical protein